MRISDWSSDVCSSDLVRLSKARAPDRELRLTIGSRRFILTGNGAHGWASDARMDAAIVAAMRSAPSMSVESGTPDDRAIADTYRLRGGPADTPADCRSPDTTGPASSSEIGRAHV